MTTARVALLGNPNTGKTSLFNRLCGARAKTANFPGTTTSASRTSEMNSGRSTPTTVNVSPFSTSGLPIASAAPPNRLCHMP